MRRAAGLVPLVVATIIAGGCSMLEQIQQGPAERPQPCVEVYSRPRCLAMVDRAAAEISKTRADVTAATIIPDPSLEGMDHSGGSRIVLRISLADGSTHDSRMCGGVEMGAACTDDQRLDARSVTAGGYRDVPCADPSEGCPKPFPSSEPAVLDAATPLFVAERTIAIDHDGHHEVSLGTASLPNGILTDASFAFEGGWPDDVALAGAVGWIEVRSLEPDGKPFDNYYLHGWREGVERVEAFVIFDVLWFAPGADLSIHRVVVR